MGEDLESAYIIPLSDLHIGSSFDEDKFLGYRQWILDRKNAFCFINGDILNMNTRGSVGSPFEDIRPREQRILAVKYLEPLARAGKILAYVDGNHEARAQKDSDEFIGEVICEQMGIYNQYSADGALIFLSCGYNRAENKKARNVYTIFMLHGWSGARMVGGKANNLESMSKSVVADCYLAAHTHTKIAFSKRILIPDTRTKDAKWKKQVFVSTGSFLEWDGYGIRKGYSPATLGAPRIRLDGRRHDIHVSV